MALTPEQLAAYRKALAEYQSQHQGNFAYKDPSGQTIMDAGGSGWNAGGDGALSVGDYKPGGTYDYVDPNGKDIAGLKGQYGMPQGLGKELAMYAAILGGVGAAGGMFGGSGLFGGGGAAGAAGDAVLPGALGVDGAAMGSGILPGLEPYAATGGFLGDTTAAGYGGLDAQSAATMGGGASVNGGAALGGAGVAAGGAAGAAGAGGLKSLLGPAAALLGGVAGGQGGGGAGDMQRKMDPRLDAAVFGDNGLVPRAQGLLAQQMTPERMAGYEQLRKQGLGLLSQPVAGNGFDRFYPGK